MINPALAERLCSMAQGVLRSQALEPATWQYAEALLQGATRLAPQEPRFARFLKEAATRAGDEKTVRDTMLAYRRLQPDDQVAATELIEMYLAPMEKAEARSAYLKGIIDNKDVSAPVRSYAAVRCAQVLFDQLHNEEGGRMIETALQLNPLNLAGLRIRYEALRAGPAAPRLAGMLDMMRSNPVQPGLGIAVARELAGAGLFARSVDWYNLSLDMHRRLGIAPPEEVGVDYACELYLNGDANGAASVAEQLTKTSPDDLNAWLLKLILSRRSTDKAAANKIIHQATIALGNRLAVLEQAAGNKQATTRPIDSAEGEVTLPDASATLHHIADTKKPQLIQQFVSTAGGIAWLKIYFENQPQQAVPWTNAIAQVVPETDDVLARLQGWARLKAGNKDDAKVKLSAVADRDAVAALGLIELADPKDKAAQEKATEQGKRLLSENPAGLDGVLLADALAPRGLKPQPAPTAPQVEAELAKFPKDWLKILDQPQAFYVLRLAPVNVGVQPGEPVMVNVSIQNISEYPLTIGDEGVIHPDLWLDAQLRGVQNQAFPAEAYDRLSRVLVLPPGQTVSQAVRLDQRALNQILAGYPAAGFQITARVITNPTTLGGQITTGPAGYQAQLTQLMDRPGIPINQDQVRQQLFVTAQQGTPSDKVQAVEIMATFVQVLLAPDTPDPVKQLGAQVLANVRHATEDPDPTVRGWAQYLLTLVLNDPKFMGPMIKDPGWPVRMLAIVANDYRAQGHDLIKPLEKDPDPVIARLATASVSGVIKRPTSAPANGQPATQPAVASPAAPASPGGIAPATVNSGSEAPLPPSVLAPAPPAPPTVPAPPAQAEPSTPGASPSKSSSSIEPSPAPTESAPAAPGSDIPSNAFDLRAHPSAPAAPPAPSAPAPAPPASAAPPAASPTTLPAIPAPITIPPPVRQ
jgi:hypothetical protein